MATRRSSRLLNKNVTPASVPKSSDEDMDADSDEKYVSDCSSSEDEYRPPKKQDSSDESEDDVPAKKSKHIDLEPTHVSDSSADEPFELACLGVDLSEGGTSSDDDSDSGADTKKRPKKSTAPKKQYIQAVKIPKLSQIKRANNSTLNMLNSDKNPSERRLQLDSLPGFSKSLLFQSKKHHSTDSTNQALQSTRIDNVMKEGMGDGNSSESLKDVISAMLLENEPQASCSYTVNDAPKSKQLKSKRTAKNSQMPPPKQSASIQDARSPVKTRSKQLQAAKTAKSSVSSAKSGKKSGKTSLMAETQAKDSSITLPEVKKQHLKNKKTAPQRIKAEKHESSSESDWEEVPEGADLDNYAPVVPEDGITITLKEPVMTGKRKKSKFDPVAEMRRRINRVRKEIHVLKHKAHLLCLLAHGMRLNSLMLDQTLHGVALSLLPSEFMVYAGKTVTLLDVERMSRLFTKVFVCKLGHYTSCRALHDDLKMALTTKIAQNARDYALLFLVIVRCLQIEARLCMSLYPVPLDAVKLLKTDVKTGEKSTEIKTPSKKKAKGKHCESDEEDSDFEVVKSKKATSKKKVCDDSSTKKSGKKSGKKQKTAEENAQKLAQDISDSIEHWVEVFTPKDSKWIAVDVVHGSVGSIKESNIREPLYYVLSFDNHDKVKDITRKYASGWLTTVKKKRIDPKWWEESLKPFSPTDCERERVENIQIQSKLQRQPMPASIAEFKNHPLYALKRHLLKFEAIYPPDAPSLGFVRGEPVYARECIHTLRSRETWLREARMVRVKEQPYKIVKARPRYDKLSGQILKEQPLELFGLWQTEPYMPPIAFNGKVPRNEWGNVELFKSCMLPVGTVHLRAPGLARVAAKLNIDCVPAVVGFEGHCRGIHPVFDGWVVCEEFKDTLMAAWEEEQANISNREQEKRLKRIYGNWKKLIKGVLIKEKLRMKYMNDD